MWSTDRYKTGSKTMSGRSIFDNIELGDKMDVEKGEIIDDNQYYIGKIVKAPWI